MVGYSQAADPLPYWIIRNSWGESWGIGGIANLGGYARIEMAFDSVSAASAGLLLAQSMMQSSSASMRLLFLCLTFLFMFAPPGWGLRDVPLPSSAPENHQGRQAGAAAAAPATATSAAGQAGALRADHWASPGAERCAQKCMPTARGFHCKALALAALPV